MERLVEGRRGKGENDITGGGTERDREGEGGTDRRHHLNQSLERDYTLVGPGGPSDATL